MAILEKSEVNEMYVKGDTPRFLMTLPTGIGDTISTGLSAIDQIITNDPEAWGTIDIFCNPTQAEIFEHDPRINRAIQVDRELFPVPERMRSWLRGIFMPPRAIPLVRFVRRREYEAIFPAMFTPTFYVLSGSRIMVPDLWELRNDFQRLMNFEDIHLSTLARKTVNRYFGNRLPEPDGNEGIPLYICPEHLQKAAVIVENMKQRTSVPEQHCRLVMVAPDTSSAITRPPTNLLAAGLADALKRDERIIVCILPGYSDVDAAKRLFYALRSSFEGRIFLMEDEPRATLLQTAAFIDQADVFISGDTGLMHLAVAVKRLASVGNARYFPRNSVKIITLFGGTNPGFEGYSHRALVLGKGREEQRKFRPGIVKESYNPRGRDFFDHIAPQCLTEALLSQLDTPTQTVESVQRQQDVIPHISQDMYQGSGLWKDRQSGD